MAPAIFQHITNSMIIGLKGMAAYLNNTKVVGRKEKELKERTECPLERITDYGFHQRSEKCVFLEI